MTSQRSSIRPGVAVRIASGEPFVSLVAQLPDYGPDHPAEEYLLCFDCEQAQAAGRVLLNAGRKASPPPVTAGT